MKKFYFIVIIFLLFSSRISAQVTYTWVGLSGDDYQVATNWSPVRTALAANDILAFNASSAIVVNNVPLQTIGAVRILSGTGTVSFATNSSSNVLTLSAAVPLIYTTAGSILSADFLTINISSAASFSISAGTFGIAPNSGGKVSINGAITLSGGTLSFDVLSAGGTTITSTGSITYISGTFASANTPAIVWQAGSNYNHAFTGTGASAIPASTWQANSNCNITGMSAPALTAPSGLTGIDFANFKWNCASQVANADLLPAGSTLNILGTLSIISTGTKELRLSAAGKASVAAAYYVQSGGILTLQAAATADTTILTIAKDFSQTGGNLNGVGGSSAGTGILDMKGNVTTSGSVFQSTSTSTSSQLIIQFSGITGQTVTLSGTWSQPAAGLCNVSITNASTSGVILTGLLRVYNTNNSTVPATCTMAGNISPQDAFSYVYYGGSGTAGRTLIYSGSFFQTASVAEFPASPAANLPNNLTINNMLGVTFPVSFSRTITGTLSMLNGNLAIGAGNTLQLTNTLANQLNYVNGFITTGTLSRLFPTTGLPTSSSDTRSLFPFGTGINNRSLNLYFSSNTLTSGAPGMVSVTHNPVIGISPLSLVDNSVTLDKRTKTNWTINTGAFNMGTGTTAALTTVCANVGSVDVINSLRLTDTITVNYGTLIPATGTTSIPTIGKSGLTQADISNKSLYVGSDAQNQLIIITFTWTGLGGDPYWTNPGNWTGAGAVGYPSASTEIAILNTTSGTQPTIKATDNISVYQLFVGSPITLTMTGAAIINVFDSVNFAGTPAFAPASTFGYSSSSNPQYVLDLAYGGLSFSGTAAKVLPATIRVTGQYSVSGIPPDILSHSNTFIYTGTIAQSIAPANYYNLTITGNRGGSLITLGSASFNNTIDIKNVFDISGLSNYTEYAGLNTINFSGASQFIPGFYYCIISNSAGARTLDPLGSTDPNHIIYCRALNRPSTPAYAVTGSKVSFYVTGTKDVTYFGATYYDLTLSGNVGNHVIDFANGQGVSIAGKFDCTLTNWRQGTSSYYFCFNGTGDQTIPGFKSVGATNSPGFKYSNLIIQGGNRNVTLGATDTVAVTDGIQVPKSTNFTSTGYANLITPFSAGKGFIVNGSTVNFVIGSFFIPKLTISSAGTYNYNNLLVTGGTCNFDSSNTIVGGSVSVTGTDAAKGVLNIGDGNNPRVLTILGNLSGSGTGAGPLVSGTIDMNTGTNGSTKLNLGGNLSISGKGQLYGTTTLGKNNGVIVFNGKTPQTYFNNSTFRNGLVNFNIGDGITNTKLTLLSSLDLVRSDSTLSMGTLTVLPNDSLDCSTFNVATDTVKGNSGLAKFNLKAGATLITANLGGVEGLATNTSTGSILNDATLVRSYDDLANYTFNANTTTPFSAASVITKMANLNVAANVTLDKSIETSNTLTLIGSATLDLKNFYLNLKSTVSNTAKVAAVPAGASISYSGSGRFVVERYYPSRRAWRLMTAPVTVSTAQSIFSSWQLNGVNTISGSGTFITGPNANPSANGLDISPESNTSLKLGTTLTPVNNTKTQLISGTAGVAGTPDNLGMFLFVRGDRTTTSLYNPSVTNITTLRDTGRIQIKTQTFSGLPVGSAFTLIGNPYASPVDFNLLTLNNLARRFYVWDPYLNSSLGGYITFEDFANTGVYTPTPASPGHMTQILQSSQAIFVQTAANGAASLVFNESDKSSAYNPSAFRPMGVTKSFRTNLYLLQPNDSVILADGNLAEFDKKFSKDVTIDDAIKFGNVYETLSIQKNDKSLSVARRPDITENDTLFLKLDRTSQRNYQFQFEPANMDVSKNAFLEDSYTGIKTPLSLSSATTFNFSVNSDARSSAPGRFIVVFKQTVAAPLPVTYKTIKAYEKTGNITIEWTVENELNVSRYEVEKSTDGVTFAKINTTAPKGAPSGVAAYSIADSHPAPGNNFYRVASYGQNGSLDYSKVVMVNIAKLVSGLSIYPNPVTGNTIGLAINDMQPGNYNIRLINNLGQILMVKQISHSNGNSMETLKPNNKLSAGIYQLEVTGPDNHINVIKVIVQ